MRQEVFFSQSFLAWLSTAVWDAVVSWLWSVCLISAVDWASDFWVAGVTLVTRIR